MTDAISGLEARAEALLHIRRYADASEVLGQVLGSQPENVRALCLLAQCKFGLQDRVGGLKLAESACGLAPDTSWPHRLRSHGLLKMGRINEALRAAEKAVELAPADPECQGALAEARLAVGDLDAAELAARQRLRLAPHDPASHGCLGRVELARRRIADAELHFRDALALDATDSAALNNLGITLQLEGRRREALHCFAQAAARDPGSYHMSQNTFDAATGPRPWMFVVGAALVALVGAVGAAQGTIPVWFGVFIAVGAGVQAVIVFSRAHRQPSWVSTDDPRASRELERDVRRLDRQRRRL